MNENLLIFISLAARPLLAIISYVFLSRCILLIKKAWHENNQKKMNVGIAYLWGSIISACMFVKMFKGV